MNLSLPSNNLSLLSRWLRRHGAPFPRAACLAALLVAGGARGRAASEAPAAFSTPILSADATVRQVLQELDRRLEESPAIEDALRTNLDRLTEESFLANHPKVEALLAAEPAIVPALKAERHFFIHRYVARRARGPLLRPDLVALDRFLAVHADIRGALDRRPSQIVEADFLIAHPSLADFFVKHPSLSTVLLVKSGV
jgi:hypothetical protein